MTSGLLFVFFLVFLAFLFDFINGFHDAANSIATIVTTGVLKPWQAVIWAAGFNFLAVLFFKLAVATTVGTGIISPEIVSPYLIFAALTGAIIWNLSTWYLGLPSSSSHALIGGLVGAAFASGGTAVLEKAGFIKFVLTVFISPILGLIFAMIFIVILKLFARNYSEKTHVRSFKYLQLFSSALLSISHGGNDAQKTMGVIAVLLYSSGLLGRFFYVPTWVVITCYIVIGLGTLMGGWRIVRTVGEKITKLTPMLGCAAETGSALTIALATHFGIPVSTTYTVTGAIAGVGLIKGVHNIQWRVITKIVTAWLLTLPAAASIAALIIWLTKL